jgi:hypothetical protein
MIKFLCAGMLALALVAFPPPAVADPVGDRLTAVDIVLTELLRDSFLEKVFSSVFGLTYLGEAYGKLCENLEGEWDPEVPECRLALFE